MNRMKSFLLLALIMGSRSALAADSVFDCAFNAPAESGEGTVVLTIKSNNTVTVVGNYTNKDASTGDTSVSVNCTGKHRPETHAQMFKNKAFYDTGWDETSMRTCPAMYVRVYRPLLAGKPGIIDLARPDGDRHDWSGYEYTAFRCTKRAE